MATRNLAVSMWYDNRPGVEAGWVARATEHDDDGIPVGGRVAMDESIDAGTREDVEAARDAAAHHWGVDPSEVTIETG